MRIECRHDDDARLIAGLGALVARAARHAGLAPDDTECVAVMAMQTCREAFAQARRGSGALGLERRLGALHRSGQAAQAGKRRAGAIRITISGGNERMEVAVEYEGEAINAARQKLLRESASEAGTRRGGQAGELRFEASDGRCCVRLSKYCGGVKAGCPSLRSE
jgi:hypothetical protein